MYETAACNWTATDCPCNLDEVLGDPVRAEQVREWAVDLLWRRTGMMYGGCPVQVRPCRHDCHGGGGLSTPARLSGQWVNIGCARCPGDCSCTEIQEVLLPGPVGEVLEVLVDGVPLGDPATIVRVDDRKRVVRIDGGRWPTCQSLDAPPTDAGTWAITYIRGLPVPAGGSEVAGILACELAKACVGDNSCRLPRRVQQYVRQGVTVRMMDDFDTDGGGFGIFEVDSWLASLRRDGPRRTMMPRSPDVPRQRIQTWPEPTLAGVSP